MDFVEYLHSIVALCYKHRGSVSSWGRTEKHNKAEGGVVNSWHLLWLGCDIILDDNRLNPIFEHDASLLGLEALWERDHYHIEPKG